MKVAVCFFGFIGNTQGPVTGNVGHSGAVIKNDYIFENQKLFLIDHLKADVYLHTWSFEDKKRIMSELNPLDSLYEKVISPENLVGPNNIHLNMKNRIKELFYPDINMKDYMYNEFYGNSSRWLSAKKSLDLAFNSGIHYDAIISCRLDLIFNRSFDIPENLQENELLVSHWNDAKFNGTRNFNNQNNYTYEKKGFMDLWFAGSSSAMKKLSLISENLDKLSVFSHLSSFEHAMNNKLTPRFQYYRGIDYELYRRQVLNSSR